MLTPQELEKVPKGFEKLMNELEERVMQDIVRRIAMNSEITRSVDWQIYRLNELGKSKSEIKHYIQKALRLSNKQIEKLYKDIMEKEYTYNKKLYDSVGKDFIPFNKNKELQQLINATMLQTKEELNNITQSLGFAVEKDGKIVFKDIAKYYQNTLDNAVMDIVSGNFDYNTVLKRTVQEMTKSGLRTVDYVSGWSNRIEVATRRAVMTGVTQITAKVNEMNAEQLETDYFEVSWHGTARPSHQIWQGRVYSKKELIDICGLGTGEGLCGWNCRHSYSPFIPGVSVRTYTDEQLAEMNQAENTPKEYKEKQYTKYEASQKQRKMETLMRKQRQEIKLLRLGGASEEDIISTQAKYRSTMSQYAEFSKQMGLPQQLERVYGTSSKISIDKSDTSDIINLRKVTKEVEELKYIGNLDKNKLGEFKDKIITEEVILTNERAEHILLEHKKEYEQLKNYMSEIIQEPDYILKDNRHDDTIILLKNIENTGNRGRIVIKLALGIDESHPKNSIITLMKLNERTWNQTLKNRGEIIFDKSE